MMVLLAERVINLLKEAAPTSELQELLQLTADLVQSSGPPYTSVYLYMLHGEELILEAFSGRETEHTRIKVGHGVCGTAVAEGKDQNVGDVRACTNYIACNLFTKSELVVLIHKNGTILGQIDVDSDCLDPFSTAEEASLKQITDVLGSLL
ncbi:hypothetical protein O6H91_15G050100 [Diphasiastrum complanatum]|uniref:Uncharacterized protein n=1 Tax=Diphasiastrum complanatum TaxID=34168 RepID=A0ACC2BI53_DIPCM|nr:hypothetical protein O6H91_15G050100 [Diphasiastrum complanatum]